MEAHGIQILDKLRQILTLKVLQGAAIHVPAKEIVELFMELW